MSLEAILELADLQESVNELYEQRRVAKDSAMEKAVEDVKRHFIAYLEGYNFDCLENADTRKIVAKLHHITLTLTPPSSEEKFVSFTDASFEFAREDGLFKKVSAELILKRSRVPSYKADNKLNRTLQDDITFYKEQMLPWLQSIGTSDITGGYTFGVMNKDSGELNPIPIADFITALLD